MNIILACDSFKGTLSSKEVNEIIKTCILDSFPSAEIHSFVFADGGEGTLDALKENLGERVEIKTTEVTSAIPQEKIQAKFGIFDHRSAIIEVAQIVGLPLLGARKNPFQTTTLGIGELISHCLENKISDFLVGLGGSSTNDLGAGMLLSAGIRFLDSSQQNFLPLGGTLNQVVKVDISSLSPLWKKARFHLLSDVTNPLLGPYGATFVFAPQKGAKSEELPSLENGMSHLCSLLEEAFHKSICNLPGAGAAGGLGAAFSLFSNTERQSGAQTIYRLSKIEDELSHADLLITGEGRVDSSSFDGKAISILLQEAKKCHVPSLVIGGYVNSSLSFSQEKYGNPSFLSVEERNNMSLEELKANAKTHLKKSLSAYLRNHPFPPSNPL